MVNYKRSGVSDGILKVRNIDIFKFPEEMFGLCSIGRRIMRQALCRLILQNIHDSPLCREPFFVISVDISQIQLIFIGRLVPLLLCEIIQFI